MARRRKTKRSDNTIKYVLIGVAALAVLFLIFNVGPTGKYIDVPTECEWTLIGNTWTATVPGFCSPDSDLRYEADCIGGVCSDGTSTDQATCEAAGSCDESQHTTQATCEGAGICGDPIHNNDESTCITRGTCSDGTLDVDQATCEAEGSCSDPTQTTERECVDYVGTCTDSSGNDITGVWTLIQCQIRAGTCTDSTSNSKSTCESNDETWTYTGTWNPDNTWNSETWTANTWTSDDNTWTSETWTDNTWTAAVPGSCSDGTSTDQTSCEEAATCSDGVSTTEAECIASDLCTAQQLEDADGDGIDDTEDTVWDITQTGLTTNTEEVEVNTYSLSNDGIFSMELQSRTSLSGGCSDGTSADQATCETDKHTWTDAAEASCSDSILEDQATCEDAGTCSDTTSTDQTTCEDAEETWSSETWTEASDATCSDEVSTDQTTCEDTSVNTWNEASDILTDLQSATVLVKVDYYDLETNEVISSTLYTSQLSIGETASESFAISIPQADTAVSYVATVNVWSGMIGTADWQSYSEKIELRGEFHP